MTLRKLRVCLPALATLMIAAAAARAEEVLFIGNSFTRSLPPVVEKIAGAKKKLISDDGLIQGGKNWGYHLEQKATTEKLGAEKWDFVVAQDLSTEPTHIGNIDRFMADGEKLYRKIRERAPQAKIVLYQTWAYAAGHKIFGEASTPTTFANPAEMTKELATNYAALAKKLEAIDPGDQIVIAPVGEAFARCLARYPDIHLHGPDDKHPSDIGRYLSALVIYATIYNDSPVGPDVTPGVKVPADVAAKLQKIAEETIAAAREAKSVPATQPAK